MCILSSAICSPNPENEQEETSNTNSPVIRYEYVDYPQKASLVQGIQHAKNRQYEEAIKNLMSSAKLGSEEAAIALANMLGKYSPFLLRNHYADLLRALPIYTANIELAIKRNQFGRK